MKFQKTFSALLSLILLALFAVFAIGQTNTNKNERRIDDSTIVYTEKQAEKMPIAAGNNLYCAGYIQQSSVAANVEIVGATEEKDKHVFAEGDDIYLNSGASNGVKVGDMYSVIRPRGKVDSDWTTKKDLGIWIQEIGAVEVIAVMNDVAVAKVKSSCDVVMFGDLLTPVVKRESPMFKKRGPLDKYAASSGKASGRIVMSREGRELLGREMIAYVDLGREDNVKVGDYLTIYRPLGTGNIYSKVPRETGIDNKEDGYETERYQGGHFSIQASRKKGENAGGSTVTTEGAKSRRPAGLRRIVGEMIVLNVMERTATVMVVRATTEIHTSDFVEIQ